MELFTQKWCLLALLEPCPVGTEFAKEDWPLHITLAGVFKMDDLPAELEQKLQQVTESLLPFDVTTESIDYFGPRQDVRVMRTSNPPSLKELHLRILEVLSSCGVEFNSPEYVADGYVPHITLRNDRYEMPGEAVAINNITLVDMFPGGDANRRKIAWTISF